MENPHVMEGFQTYTVYLPPVVIKYLLTRGGDGVTLVFSKDTLELDHHFQKDEQYSSQEIGELIEFSKQRLEEMYGTGSGH